MANEWTPVQERVMDLVYGGPAGDWWHGPCGHGGHQMTVSPDGIVTCHHQLSSRHDHTRWLIGGKQSCKPPACEIVECGRTYTEAELP
jgi:hypothetical protein